MADQAVLRCLISILQRNLATSKNMENLKYMKSEESIGCVIIYEHVDKQSAKRKSKEDLFLVMQSHGGDWNFVKGIGNTQNQTKKHYEERFMRKQE